LDGVQHEGEGPVLHGLILGKERVWNGCVWGFRDALLEEGPGEEGDVDATYANEECEDVVVPFLGGWAWRLLACSAHGVEFGLTDVAVCVSRGLFGGFLHYFAGRDSLHWADLLRTRHRAWLLVGKERRVTRKE
jgi:hypothetical protein